MTPRANPPPANPPVTLGLMCDAAPEVFACGLATTPHVSFDLDDWAWSMERAAHRHGRLVPGGRGVHGA